jgi:hypothetical protein
MNLANSAMRRYLFLGGVGLALVCGSRLIAQQPDTATGKVSRDQLREPMGHSNHGDERVATRTENQIANTPPGHPLDPAIKMANECLAHIGNDIKDYTATIHKHEQVDGKLQERQQIFVKMRHEPFSAYLYFLGPNSVKGRECIYVAGKNNGNLCAHDTGIKGLIRVNLDPNGALAMQGQRYPITKIGFLNLAKELVERAEQDKKAEAPENCVLKFLNDAKIGSRACTGVELSHEIQRPGQRFQRAVVCVDKQLGIPIHYTAWDWPSQKGGKPELLEEYTYSNIKLNVGLTDKDFDPDNKEYHFP